MSDKSKHERPSAVVEILEARVLLSGWTDGVNFVPTADGAQLALLMPNGSVLVHGGAGAPSTAWYELTPDNTGSYVNGTWSTLAPMNVGRLYFGSDVLPNDKVFVLGGEVTLVNGQPTETDANSAEIYDINSNTWTNVASDPKAQVGDSSTELLQNGNVLVADLQDRGTEIYNPTSNTWTAGPSKVHNDRSDEENWVKLPDGSILTYDIFSSISAGVGKAERYIPSSNTWVDASAGTLPVLTSDAQGDESGGSALLPDGRAFWVGANGLTAYFNSSSDIWSQGPTLPMILNASNQMVQGTIGDGPMAIEPNGDVLMAVSPEVTENPTGFPGPTYIFEFNPTTGVYTDVTPSPSIMYMQNNSFVNTMLVLPTGQILMVNDSEQVAIYTPDGTPQAAWQPQISNVVNNGGGNYTITGTQLNGMDEGAYYGDDAQMASNYPIVRLTDLVNANVLYAESSNWSLTGVATGSASETVNFAVPAGLGSDPFSLVVVANGIASASVNAPTLATAFSNLTASESIPFGTASVTLSGTISAGATLFPPSGENVVITLNHVSMNATIGSQGQFSATFNTTNLPIAGTPYQVLYSYAGDANFSNASDNSTTTVTVTQPATIVNNGLLTITMNEAVGVITGTGTLAVQTGVTLTLAPINQESGQNALTVDGTGSVDITDNTFDIYYGVGNPSPAQTIGAYIASGYNGATFTGPGIVSSTVASVNAAHGDPELYAIGYADASDMAVQKQDFDAGTVVVKPALVGDANLDGVVNFSDFLLLAASFNMPNTSWDQGNFNYGSKTNFTDFLLLANNFNDSTSLDDAQLNAMNQIAQSGGFNLTPNANGFGFSATPIAKAIAPTRRKNAPAGKTTVAAVLASSGGIDNSGVFGSQKITAETGRLDLAGVTDIFGR